MYRSLVIVLNESNYDLDPSIFSSFITLNWGLTFEETPDGIQECATYNPPGPTEPSSLHNVCIIRWLHYLIIID